MNVFKTFLREKYESGIPLFSLMIGTQCEKCAYGIKDAFVESFKSVKANIESSSIEHSSLTLKSKLELILYEFDLLYDTFRLED